MLDIRDYDELNDMVGFNRSEDFKSYFDVMEISDEAKESRISLADKLEDNFLFVLAFLFTMQRYNNIDWENIQYRFESAYREALKSNIAIDESLDTYIRQFSYDVTNSTQSHIDDPYYYSADRARMMAENESNTSWNYADFSDALKRGKTKKKWVDIRDKRERETHRQVGGTIKPINEPFIVGNSLMLYPKDSSLGANLSQIANCRCSIKYL
jgi:hypothetical protein